MPVRDASTDTSLEQREQFQRLRRENLARLLVRTFDMMERDVLLGFEAAGIRLRKTWLPVLRNVPLDGGRIKDIAEAAGLSKQTVGPLVKELAAEGILRVDPDPTDGRAKRVRFTEEGLAGLRVGMQVLAETEERYARAVGSKRLGQLRRTLMDLLEAFESLPQEA